MLNFDNTYSNHWVLKFQTMLHINLGISYTRSYKEHSDVSGLILSFLGRKLVR